MEGVLRVSIRQDDRPPFSQAFSGPVELGRIDPNRAIPETLLVPSPVEGVVRIPIADLTESDVSRRQARLEPAPEGRVRLTNLSHAVAIRCFGRPDVPPGQSVEFPLPLGFQIGRCALSVEMEGGEGTVVQPEVELLSLEQPTVMLSTMAVPAAASGPVSVARILAASTGEVEPLVTWWRQLIAVLQSASNSTDFFQKSARALVDLVGLDLGAVYVREREEWKPGALATRERSRARASTSVLARVLAEKRTFWNKVDTHVDVLSSMSVLEAYVAAPILDVEGNVLGALYGHREGRPGEAGKGEITQLEALLVETLACGVAAGLSRLEEQKATLRQKVQFEQFFSARLAERLEAEPDLLQGRDAEVTVLFCDLREFSAVSEKVGPAKTMEWIGGVLDPLSDEVVAAGGVLVDYVGDELLAMWGAPSPQADHARLACATARRMVEALPRINERWAGVIGRPTRFGIGINSATARVGNTGSARKFKYGPLGNGVNLGSRVQGATKYLRVDALITGSTRRQLDDSFRVRRVCTVQVVNIAEPVELYELDCGTTPRSDELFPRFEAALAAFEAGSFSAAASRLGGLLDEFPGDGPALVLLSRAVDCMVNPPAAFSPVWKLPGK